MFLEFNVIFWIFATFFTILQYFTIEAKNVQSCKINENLILSYSKVYCICFHTAKTTAVKVLLYRPIEQAIHGPIRVPRHSAKRHSAKRHLA